MSRVVVSDKPVVSEESSEVILEALNVAEFRLVQYADTPANQEAKRVGLPTNTYVASVQTRQGGKPTQVGITVQQFAECTKVLGTKSCKVVGILLEGCDLGEKATGGAFVIRKMADWKAK